MAAVNRYTASIGAGDSLGENAEDCTGATGIKESTFFDGPAGGEPGVLPPARKPGDSVEGDSGVPERPRERKQHMKAYEKLREELRPAYETFFRNIVAESDDGVRFVVTLRQVKLSRTQRNHAIDRETMLLMFIFRRARPEGSWDSFISLHSSDTPHGVPIPHGRLRSGDPMKKNFPLDAAVCCRRNCGAAPYRALPIPMGTS